MNERSIAHKLTNYLQAEFLGWEVDCEHNRNHDNPKTLPLQRKKVSNDDLHACTVFPNIIVRHRNTDSNLLVIEIKKSTNTSSASWDKQKLSAFKKVLGYKFAIFLRLETGSNSSGRTCRSPHTSAKPTSLSVPWFVILARGCRAKNPGLSARRVGGIRDSSRTPDTRAGMTTKAGALHGRPRPTFLRWGGPLRPQ